jgi:hypothetical protein
VAETQAEETNREKLLNRVILFLTAFTFVSVVTDSFQFVKYEEGWLAVWFHRLLILIGLLAIITVIIDIVLRWIVKPARRG